MLKTISSKVLTLTCFIILFSIGASLVFNIKNINEVFSLNSKTSFLRAEELAENIITNSSRNIQIQARLLALLPILRAVVDTGDKNTISNIAKNYQEKLNIPIFDIFSSEKKLLYSNLNKMSSNTIKMSASLLYLAEKNSGINLVMIREGRVAILDITPVGTSEDHNGWILTGQYLDEVFIERIKKLTGLEFLIYNNGTPQKEVSAGLINKALKENISQLIKTKKDQFLKSEFNLVKVKNIKNTFKEDIQFVFYHNLVSENIYKMKFIKYTLIIGLITLLLAIILTLILISKLLRPFYEMKNNIVEIQKSKDLDRRIKISGGTEIMTLCESFNSLMDELKKYNEQIIDTSNVIGSSKLAALGEMAGGIAHEINNPLAIIDGYAGQISDVLNKGPLNKEKLLKIENKILTTVARITKIIRGLKFFARDASNDPFDDVLIKDVIESTLSLCFEKFKGQSIEIRTHIENESVVFGSNVQLSQVILNLLNNSRDAIEDLPDKWIELTVKNDTEKVFITLKDCGQGIKASVIKDLFRPFFTTKPVGKGTGLGLSVCQGIVKQHQGEIHYDSSCENTCFIIELPIKK